MKKINRTLALLTASILALLLTACGAPASSEELVTPKSEPSTASVASSGDASADSTDETALQSSATASSASTEVIGVERAKEIALDQESLTEDQVTGLKVKLDEDDGQQEYDVEFYANGCEYDFDIDAYTGEILGRSVEPEDSADSQQTAGGDGTSSTQQSSDLIGEDKALEIALTHAGLSEDQITGLKVKLDTDDGRQEYEVEFYQDSTEYEYEIDAYTGEVFSYDMDGSHSHHNTSGEASDLIGKDKAIELALAHAGLSEDQVTKLEAKLDKEDGQQIYEVEFRQSGTEYEYDIDAATGTILSYSIDRD